MPIKPGNLAEWGTGAAPIVEPTLAEKQAGWSVSSKPPAQWFNWWMKLVYQWIAWLDGFESTAHDWTALQTFKSGLIFDNTSSVGVYASSAWTFLNLPLFNQGLLYGTGGFVDAIDTDYGTVSYTLIATRTYAAGLKSRLYWGNSAAGTGTGFTVTQNARWNQGTGKWIADNIAVKSSRFTLGADLGFAHSIFDGAAGVPWNDSDWFSATATNLTQIPPGGTGITNGIFQTTVAGGQTKAAFRQFLQQETVTTVTPNGVFAAANNDLGLAEPLQAFRDSCKRVHVHGLVAPSADVGTGYVVATLPWTPVRTLSQLGFNRSALSTVPLDLDGSGVLRLRQTVLNGQKLLIDFTYDAV